MKKPILYLKENLSALVKEVKEKRILLEGN